MRVRANSNGLLNFDFVDNIQMSPEQAAQDRLIRSYTFLRLGANIFVCQEKKLICRINAVDNTQFIFDPKGYEIAAAFGMKRFVVGPAHDALVESKETIKFTRDRLFPLITEAKDPAASAIPFKLKVANLKTFLSLRPANDQVYEELAELFDRCANFTPGKQAEYKSGGQKEDKYCRFNLDNNGALQVFLLDEKRNNKVIGTISATILKNSATGKADVYFYDEVVDYFTLLSDPQIAALHKLNESLSIANEALAALEKVESQEVLKSEVETQKWVVRQADLKTKIAGLTTQIADIVEPARTQLMEFLFAAARKETQQMLGKVNVFGLTIQQGKIRGFIRVAQGRESAYRSLGCAEQNNDIFVIHGSPTPLGKVLQDYLKQTWASQKLAVMNNPVVPETAVAVKPPAHGTTWMMAAAGIGALLLGVGLFAAYRRESSDAARHPKEAPKKPSTLNH